MTVCLEDGKNGRDPRGRFRFHHFDGCPVGRKSGQQAMLAHQVQGADLNQFNIAGRQHRHDLGQPGFISHHHRIGIDPGKFLSEFSNRLFFQGLDVTCAPRRLESGHDLRQLVDLAQCMLDDLVFDALAEGGEKSDLLVHCFQPIYDLVVMGRLLLKILVHPSGVETGPLHLDDTQGECNRPRFQWHHLGALEVALGKVDGWMRDDDKR